MKTNNLYQRRREAFPPGGEVSSREFFNDLKASNHFFLSSSVHSGSKLGNFCSNIPTQGEFPFDSAGGLPTLSTSPLGTAFLPLPRGADFPRCGASPISAS